MTPHPSPFKPDETPPNPYTNAELDDLIEKITTGPKDSQITNLTYDETIRIIKLARIHMSQQKSLVHVSLPAAIFGDIHGRFDSLYAMYCRVKINMDKKCYNNRRLVFTGDIVDRGEHSIRCILFIFLQCLRWPKFTTLTRGNHESLEINGAYGFWDEVCAMFTNETEAKNVWKECNITFSWLPIVALVDKKIFCVHGGISEDMHSLKDIENIPRPQVIMKGMAHEATWGDPGTLIVVKDGKFGIRFWVNHERKTAHYYSEEAVQETMKKLEIWLICRGHTACSGVMSFAKRLMLTLFSSPGYCESGNKGSVMLVEADMAISFNFYTDSNGDVHQPRDSNITVKLNPEDQNHIKPSAGSNEKKAEKPQEDTQPVAPAPKGPKLPLLLPVINMLTILLLLNPVTCFKPPYSFGNFADMSSTLARVVNGISIGENLANKTVDKRQLIDEFFPLGHGITLDNLGTWNMDKWAGDFEMIQAMVSTECSGDNGCGIPTNVLKTMEILFEFQKDVPALENALKATDGSGFGELDNLENLVNNMKTIRGDFKKINEKVGEVVEKAKQNQPISEFQATLVELSETIRNFLKNLPNLDSGPSVIDSVDASVLSKVSESLNSIIPIKPISQKLESHYSQIENLKHDLDFLKGSYESFRSTFTPNFVNALQTGLESLSGLRLSSDKSKTLTAGFINGLDDVKLLSTDIKNAWLKELLNQGKKLTNLAPKLDPLNKLLLEFTPIQNAYNAVKLHLGHQFFAIKSIINADIGTFSQLHNSVSNYSACVGNIQIDLQDFGDVSKPTDLSTHASSLAGLKTKLENFLASQLDLKHSSEFSTFVAENKNNMTALEELVKNTTFTGELVSSLNKISKNLRDVDHRAAQKLLDATKLPVVKDVKQWIDDSGLIPAMKCFQKEYSPSRTDAVNPSAQRLAQLKSGDSDVDSILKLSKSVNVLADEFKKVSSTLPQVNRPKRAAINMKNGQQLSKQLGDISSVIKKLADMLKMENNLKTIFGGTKEVELAIDTVTDSQTKAGLKKIWNSEAAKPLGKNLELANKVSTHVSKMTKIKDLSDFKVPLEMASEVQAVNVDFGELASVLHKRIKDPKTDKSLENLKKLYLRFSSYQKTQVEIVLNDVKAYFDLILGIRNEVINFEYESSTKKAQEPKIWLLLIAVFLLVFAITFIVLSCKRGYL